MSLAVRTMTALWTSPFLTRPRGAASLTETTMMSPTPAKRRFDPPSTLMHWTRLAPLLSATSRLDCIWIIDPTSLLSSPAKAGAQFQIPRFGSRPSPGHKLRHVGLFGRGVGVDAVEHLPRLQLRDRPGLLDPDGLAGLEL